MSTGSTTCCATATTRAPATRPTISTGSSTRSRSRRSLRPARQRRSARSRRRLSPRHVRGRAVPVRPLVHVRAGLSPQDRARGRVDVHQDARAVRRARPPRPASRRASRSRAAMARGEPVAVDGLPAARTTSSLTTAMDRWAGPSTARAPRRRSGAPRPRGRLVDAAGCSRRSTSATTGRGRAAVAAGARGRDPAVRRAAASYLHLDTARQVGYLAVRRRGAARDRSPEVRRGHTVAAARGHAARPADARRSAWCARPSWSTSCARSSSTRSGAAAAGARR